MIAAIAAVAIGCGLMASTAASASTVLPGHPQPASVAPARDIGYAVNRPLCSTVVKVGQVTCYAMQRVAVKKGTAGAYEYLKSAIIAAGPAGGYTPSDLASFYAFNPKLDRSGQTVGIVDWYDDPHIRSDLAHFDTQYGLKAETSKSFRKVNQNGKTSPLPSSSKGKSSADEIALDVETVRGVCNTCKILLVEAKGPFDADIAAAEDTAVRLGATEVSNSFGGAEVPGTTSLASAFNHPGVVITASTGDDGWFGWDYANSLSRTPPRAASFPATSPDVVSVGGTGYQPTSNPIQYVWNNDGADDNVGATNGVSAGAAGGGCSQLFNAKSWQANFSGYTAIGCAGKRLAADVSELADPATGFDEFDTWGSDPSTDGGWRTVGGTSLASPIVAAMYALAGGSGGTPYPAQTIYQNAKLHPSSYTDITAGGNGFCGGDSTTNCGEVVYTNSNNETHNPNALGAGPVDCSFPRNTTDPVSPPPLSSECNAVIGYDGPSGVGTPIGIQLFKSNSPVVSLTTPKVVKLHHAASFTGHATPRASGAHITKYFFSWGDGRSTSSTSAHAKHTYTKSGTHTVTLTVTDSSGHQSVTHRKITVGKKLKIIVFRSIVIRAGQKAKFSAEVIDPNTGGKLRHVHWNWGDHHTSSGLNVSHTWHHSGKYIVRVTASDSTGVRTTFHARISVKA